MPKMKIDIVENGFPKEVEIDVPEGAAKWTPPSESKVLGKRITRLDGPDKVRGRAKYTYDINLPGMLFGYILRSPHAHAKIKSIDASKAEAMPGVKAVIVLDPNKELRYHGDEIAGVAATSPDAAEEAARAIVVEYETMGHVASIPQAIAENAPRVFENRPNADPNPDTRKQGDVDAAFNSSKAIVEATYETPVICHVCLETHGATAQWNGDDLTFWSSTQGVSGVRSDIAGALDIPASKVNVITHYMGGGFGSKFGAGVEGDLAARLAKKAGAPVKMMLDRRGEFLSAGNRPSSLQKIKAAADVGGKLTAWQVDAYSCGGVGGGERIPTPYIYSVPNQAVSVRSVFTNNNASRAMRAPSHPQGSFATEVMMDELAYRLNLDPLEFRKRNDPNELRHQQYELGAEAIGWNKRNPQPGAGSGPIKRGMGVASCTWGGGGGPNTTVNAGIHPDGSVEVISGTQDLGTGTRTVLAIILAEELGLDPHQIKTSVGESRFGPAGGSGGSTTCASISPAAKMAAVAVKEGFFERIAPTLQAKPEQLALRDGQLFVTKSGSAADPGAEWDSTKTQPWKQACRRLGMDSVSAQGQWVPGLSGGGVAGCQFVEVEVDTETGRVRPLKVVAVHDCGLVVNRLAVESQVNGGVIGSIGFALLEDKILDRNTGLQVNDKLTDYKVPGTFEIPEIQVILTDQPERGVIGIGEPPVIPMGGAVANAVYHACGARIRSLPITPDKILAALREKGNQA
jgi:xanthine dehydrogenase YagR molybdenum-binding subunit